MEDNFKETVTNINIKLSSENEMKVSDRSSCSRDWLNGEHQKKQDVKMSIEITPHLFNPSIHIKFNTMEMTIKKCKCSKELVGEGKRKHARSSSKL